MLSWLNRCISGVLFHANSDKVRIAILFAMMLKYLINWLNWIMLILISVQHEDRWPSFALVWVLSSLAFYLLLSYFCTLCSIRYLICLYCLIVYIPLFTRYMHTCSSKPFLDWRWARSLASRVRSVWIWAARSRSVSISVSVRCLVVRSISL